MLETIRRSFREIIKLVRKGTRDLYRLPPSDPVPSRDRLMRWIYHDFFRRIHKLRAGPRPKEPFAREMESLFTDTEPFFKAYVEQDAGSMADWTLDNIYGCPRDETEVRERMRQMLLDNASRQHWSMPRRPGPNPLHRLSEIRVPTLIVLGEKTVSAVHKTAEDLASQIGGARKVEIPDAPGLVNMDQPEAFNRLISDFLGESSLHL